MDNGTRGIGTNSRETVLSGAEVARLRGTCGENGRPLTFEEIGRRFGVSRQAAHKAFTKYVARLSAAA